MGARAVRRRMTRRRLTGQATIEAAVALFCTLVLLFGILKVALWIGERYVKREVAYESTRVNAANMTTLPPGARRPNGPRWDDVKWSEPLNQLNIFN